MDRPFAGRIDGDATVRFDRGRWPHATASPADPTVPHHPMRGRAPMPPRPLQSWPPLDEQTVRFDPPTAPELPSGRATRRSSTRRRNVWISLFTGFVVATGLVVGGFFLLGRTADTPTTAVVGDCLARSGEGAVVVPCADPKAVFTVLGRLDGRTRTEAGLSACSPFPSTTDVYWQGKDAAGTSGLALCLGPARK